MDDRFVRLWSRLIGTPLWVATVVLVVSFALLLVGGLRHWPWGFLVLAGAGVALGGVLQRRYLRSPEGQGYRSLSVRVAWLLVFVGAGLFAWFLQGAPDGVWFAGVSLAYYGLGRLVTHLRWGTWGGPKRGPRILVACGAVSTVALLSTPLGAPPWLLAAAGLALLAAPVGLATASEDAFRPGAFALPRTRYLGAGGVIAVVAGLVGLILQGLPVRPAFILAALGAVLVAAIASDTDSDILLLLLSIGIVWSFLPRDAAADRAPTPSDGESVLVALGDSYMSGEGAETFLPGTNERGNNECRRAATAYAALLTRGETSRFDDVVFIACSGAKAREVWQDEQHPGDPIRPEGEEGPGLHQLDHYDYVVQSAGIDPALVLVSIGGNDAGFGTIGRVCVLPGECSVIAKDWLGDLEGVALKVRAAYEALRAKFADVPIVVVPYPVPLDIDGCDWSAMTSDEHRFLNGFVHELNSVLRQEAARVGLHFLEEVELAFKRSRLRICDRADPKKVGVNYLAANPVGGALDERLNPRNWFHNSLHPNESGHAELADVVAAWIHEHPGLLPAEPDPEVERHDVRTVRQIMGPASVQCGDEGVPYCAGGIDDWTRLSLVAFLRFRAPFAFLIVLGSWAISLAVIGRRRRSTASTLPGSSSPS